ncbi:ketopantoate reductase family protein [Bacillus sp. Marseille-P3661]|uniref:ketopantoate reductase family protein n=1 Tax=Bacillus sp. Marseille-P3661 TaxID=1936234 RepID=UPI0015E16F37|nr:ketopantoate reductase family protein [Bacillus sp. Marseille-P3661]
MRIAIAGAGAMGSRFGYKLVETGHDVLLVDSWEEHVRTIQTNGLLVKEDHGMKSVKIKSALPQESEGEFDLLLILTKSMQTDQMMMNCQHLINSSTSVLTLQNGLGNIEVIEKYVSRDRIFAGVTTYAAEVLGPGKVQALGSGDTEIMQIDGNDSATVKLIAQALNAAGVRTEISSNVLASIWKKVSFNCALNPICTLMNNTVATVGCYEGIQDFVAGIIDEILLVAKSENIDIEKESIITMVNSVFDPKMSGHHIPSMLQDILNGRQTEVDYLNGAIVRLGEKYNIPTPNNKQIWHLIKMLEHTTKTPYIHEVIR